MKSVRAKPSASVLLRLPLRRAAASLSRKRGLDRVEWVAAALAFVVALAPMPFPLRLAAAVALAAGFAFALVWRVRRAAKRGAGAAGWIVADAKGIARHRPSGDVRLADWGSRFGVALLANEARDRGILAFTTPDQTRYVTVRASGEDDVAALRELFARSATLADADLATARSPGADDALSGADAARLLSAVRAQDATAIDRILLSDPRGAPIVLEGTELRVGDRVIDLASPLEWRAFLFLESAGALASVVQAIWVRQAGIELVLVAPLPADATARDVGVRTLRSQSSGVDRGARGADAPSPDAPPPVEQRLAIERLFMAPFRQALDRAPRASRAPSLPTQPAHREGRA